MQVRTKKISWPWSRRSDAFNAPPLSDSLLVNSLCVPDVWLIRFLLCHRRNNLDCPSVFLTVRKYPSNDQKTCRHLDMENAQAVPPNLGKTDEETFHFRYCTVSLVKDMLFDRINTFRKSSHEPLMKVQPSNNDSEAFEERTIENKKPERMSPSPPDLEEVLPIHPSLWPQLPLMIRPTPNTSTKVRGIRYSSGKSSDELKGIFNKVLPINTGKEVCIFAFWIYAAPSC